MLGSTLPEVLWRNRVGSSPALAYAHGGGSSLILATYDNLRAASDTIKCTLQEYGLAQGSVVGLLACHELNTAIALIGVITSGFTCAPLNPASTHEAIVITLKDAGASILIVRVFFIPSNLI